MQIIIIMVIFMCDKGCFFMFVMYLIIKFNLDFLNIWGIVNCSEYVYSNVVFVGKRVCENLINYYDLFCYYVIQIYLILVGFLNLESFVYYVYVIDLGY